MKKIFKDDRNKTIARKRTDKKCATEAVEQSKRKASKMPMKKGFEVKQVLCKELELIQGIIGEWFKEVRNPITRDGIDEITDGTTTDIFYDVFESDDRTLLDHLVGHCCSIIECPIEEPKSSTVNIATYNDYSHEQNMQQSSDLKVFIPTPMHHDYLSSNKYDNQKFNKNRSKQILQTVTVKTCIEEHARSILSKSAINRFARFSSQFKEFSHKQAA